MPASYTTSSDLTGVEGEPNPAERCNCDMLRSLVAALLVATVTAASSSAAPDPWKRLHRPLSIPRLEPAAPCPVSGVDRSVDFAASGVGQGIGRGPAYPVGFNVTD